MKEFQADLKALKIKTYLSVNSDFHEYCNFFKDLSMSFELFGWEVFFSSPRACWVGQSLLMDVFNVKQYFLEFICQRIWGLKIPAISRNEANVL